MRTRKIQYRFFFFLFVLLLSMVTISCTIDLPDTDDANATEAPAPEEDAESIDRSMPLLDDGQEESSPEPTPTGEAVLPINTPTDVPTPIATPTPTPTPEPTSTPTPAPTNTPTPEPTPTDIPTRNYGPGQLSYSQQNVKVFYVVNTSSKKFHYTTCGRGPTKNIAYTTSEYFANSAAARDWLISHGYEPCKVCYP